MPDKSAHKSHGHEHHRRRLSSPALYINREVSQVAFIRRVLAEAQSERHPLLERVKFVAFVGSQVDEFVMVRMAGLQDQLEAGVREGGPDGMPPALLLAELRPMIKDLLAEQQATLKTVLIPALAAEGIELLDYDQLSRGQREAAAAYFRREVLPVLTPLGVDPGHPFPHISSRSLNLAVTLHDEHAGELFARVKMPASLPRLVPIVTGGKERNGNGHANGKHAAKAQRSTFVWLEQLIAAHLDQLFPGVRVVGAHPFRVLRDADFEVQSDEAGDLLETVEQGLRERRFGSVVAVVVQAGTPKSVRHLLRENLEVGDADLISLEGPLGLEDLTQLTDLDRPDLKDAPLQATVPPELRRQDIFSAIGKGDLLLHHPYDSFSSVADFIELAARDPNVVAIKQTLYRVGQNSPIVRALLEANERGKQLAVLVELKARFDEENNIEWARMLERAGVHVVYGQVDLKTHAKVALVVRREPGGLRRYVHLGTGNYNAATARVYEDFALLTARPEIAEDVTQLFNALTGYARGVTYQKLLVAPGTLRAGLLRRIEREIERHKAGGRGHLIFKTNNLVDAEIIHALYRASQAGVRVDLLARGICSLRPGMEGVSENIRVTSLVGRFLEHSRIYYFAGGGVEEDEVLVGSADLMPRNLDSRVEVLFPIEDRALREQITQVVLPAYLRDTANAWRLLPDGTYERIKPPKGEEPFDVQAWFAHETHPRHEPAPPLALHATEPPTPPAAMASA
ncbi:MAG TPA: polyphosphate kinase 1 [Ktedonobacterales bacterium]|nr:polyphosphate kinase 1 [Ktedonobacterales bacterium]